MHPVKVSENGRYFVDQENRPVFWLGTTQWQLFREYTLEEAELILESASKHGFSFAQVMLMGVGDGTQPNLHGEKPWKDDDPLTPNDAYFQNVDAVVALAQQRNVAISMTLYHQRYRARLTLEKARAWARWVAERYRHIPTLIWSMTPEAKEEFVPVLRELAAGLKEGDGGRHLVTCKPDPAPYSSSFLHAEPWLDFNSMQTWNAVELIYPMVTHDYQLRPTKPVLMGEGAYEQGSEYGFEVTPLWIRRQAYYSYLAGAHHSYGHNDSWRVLPTWRQALEAPGAGQLTLLRRILEGLREWWLLVPDQTLLVSGAETQGQVLNLAARHQEGHWALVYCGAEAGVEVDLSKLRGAEVEAHWVDPRTAEPAALGRFATTGVQRFQTPRGGEDALLVLEAAG